MSPMSRDAPAVLAHHGIPPDADAAVLLAELAARGWEARVEELEVGRVGRAAYTPRFRVLATKPCADPGAWRGSHDHRQASGRTAEAALGRVLGRGE